MPDACDERRPNHPLTDQLVDNAVSRVGPTATVTVVTGPIAFVALAAPQVARRLTRSGAVDLPTSALVAATMLTLSDLVALHAFPPTAIPVGAVTVCLGGLYLLWLLARETSRR
jgi:iron complex transport system permease protein